MFAHKAPSLAAATLIAASLSGAPLQAQAYQQQPVTVLGHQDSLTRIVPFDDLALTTSAGRSALVHRVSKAVRDVCPDAAYAHSAYGIDYDAADCTNFAWAGADPQIRRAIDLARSGQAVAMAIQVTGAAL